MIDNIRLYWGRGGWRWTIRARNGRIIGASSEGHKKRRDALDNLRRVTGINSLALGLDSPQDSSFDQFEWSIER